MSPKEHLATSRFTTALLHAPLYSTIHHRQRASGFYSCVSPKFSLLFPLFLGTFCTGRKVEGNLTNTRCKASPRSSDPARSAMRVVFCGTIQLFCGTVQPAWRKVEAILRLKSGSRRPGRCRFRLASSGIHPGVATRNAGRSGSPRFPGTKKPRQLPGPILRTESLLPSRSARPADYCRASIVNQHNRGYSPRRRSSQRSSRLLMNPLFALPTFAPSSEAGVLTVPLRTVAT